MGKLAWGVKAKHWWALSTTFWKHRVCWHHPAMFCLITLSNFPTNNLNFQWRWWDLGYLLKYFLLYRKEANYLKMCLFLLFSNPRLPNIANFMRILLQKRFYHIVSMAAPFLKTARLSRLEEKTENLFLCLRIRSPCIGAIKKYVDNFLACFEQWTPLYLPIL